GSGEPGQIVCRRVEKFEAEEEEAGGDGAGDECERAAEIPRARQITESEAGGVQSSLVLRPGAETGGEASQQQHARRRPLGARAGEHDQSACTAQVDAEWNVGLLVGNEDGKSR